MNKIKTKNNEIIKAQQVKHLEARNKFQNKTKQKVYQV